ncbi:MAG TPA: tetratricopeptide repeat protein [Candidatus Acidoferrales bacterium]|nr:tetratricopeptide repeat protein [Candidatus Acidoferrales bacterium]
MKFRNLVVAAAATLFLAFTSFAQITAMEGDVKGEDGKPLQGAVIKIVRTDIKGNYTVKSDKKGHFFYNGLPIGTYNITVEVGGKEADGVNGVHTRLGDPVQVPFDLQTKAKARAAQNAQLQQAAATGAGLTKEQERSMTKEQKDAMEKAIKEREGSMKKNKELNDAFNTGLTALQAANASKDPAEKSKQYDVAVASLTKASELDPKQVAVWAQLADAHVGWASTKTGPEFDGEMAKGLEAYGKAIELNPNDGATHNNYALALAKAKKFDEMKVELNKAAQLDPTKAGQYYYNLGALMVNAGQNDAAVDAFKKAVEVDPKHADSYYQLGVGLVSKATLGADGKMTPVPGTVEAFQKYLELAPNGQFADGAKGMLETFNTKVDTSYKNPNAPAQKKKK